MKYILMLLNCLSEITSPIMFVTCLDVLNHTLLSETLLFKETFFSVCASLAYFGAIELEIIVKKVEITKVCKRIILKYP